MGNPKASAKSVNDLLSQHYDAASRLQAGQSTLSDSDKLKLENKLISPLARAAAAKRSDLSPGNVNSLQKDPDIRVRLALENGKALSPDSLTKAGLTNTFDYVMDALDGVRSRLLGGKALTLENLVDYFTNHKPSAADQQALAGNLDSLYARKYALAKSTTLDYATFQTLMQDDSTEMRQILLQNDGFPADLRAELVSKIADEALASIVLANPGKGFLTSTGAEPRVDVGIAGAHRRGPGP